MHNSVRAIYHLWASPYRVTEIHNMKQYYCVLLGEILIKKFNYHKTLAKLDEYPDDDDIFPNIVVHYGK